jgi:Protein of unknown function (DUF2721)
MKNSRILVAGFRLPASGTRYLSSPFHPLLFTFPYLSSMPEININTPALLFPAISLLMLAYTNRFFAIASRVRSLHDEYVKEQKRDIIFRQIKNLRRRLNMIRYMQALGVVSFLLCMVCMYCIFRGAMNAANVTFAASLICLIASLVVSLVEIFISTRAVELELSDMEGLEQNSLLDLFKRE